MLGSKKIDSPKARLNRAKGQKGKGLFKSPGGETHKTKTNIDAVRLVREIEVAVRRATQPRIVEPGAAASTTTHFPGFRDGATFRAYRAYGHRRRSFC